MLRGSDDGSFELLCCSSSEGREPLGGVTRNSALRRWRNADVNRRHLIVEREKRRCVHQPTRYEVKVKARVDVSRELRRLVWISWLFVRKLVPCEGTTIHAK